MRRLRSDRRRFEFELARTKVARVRIQEARRWTSAVSRNSVAMDAVLTIKSLSLAKVVHRNRTRGNREVVDVENFVDRELGAA